VDSVLIESFVRDGFVKFPGAVPRGVVDACAGLLWEATGLDRHDPSTWAEPVYWVGGMSQPPFVQAMNSIVVLDACEMLAGPGRWKPRDSMGSFPLRFPHDDEPDGLGWHVEASRCRRCSSPTARKARPGRPSPPRSWRLPSTARSPTPPEARGVVYLCHPFLVHAAQANHGTRPRSVWRYKVGIRPPSMTKSDPVMLAALSLVR
jgi:hypothetical protein